VFQPRKKGGPTKSYVIFLVALSLQRSLHPYTLYLLILTILSHCLNKMRLYTKTGLLYIS